MNTEKEQKHQAFEDCIITTQTIECTKCNKKQEEHNVDEIDAIKTFQNEGWRVTNDHIVYCPKCAKKKLK